MDSRVMFSSSFCFLFLLTLSFSFRSASSAILNNETDRLALLAFKAGITSDPLRVLSSWNNSIHFCQWSGVACGRRHQRVIVLDLPSHKLAGSISPCIGNLSFLKKVYLQNNSLSSEIPPELGRLRRLQHMVLHNNSLVGQIPANLSSCHNLNQLRLVYNKLGGKIPLEIGSLVKLKVSYQTLFKATDEFSSSNLIGVGSFGSVYKGTLDQDQVVAVKVFHLQRRGASKSFIVECEAMKNIRHRNLVKVITTCSSIDFHGNDFKALVYEFMDNGSLEEWLHPNSESDVRDVRRKFNLVQRLNIVIDVASALNYLHYQYGQTPIVHCDLKPSNVLLNDEMVAQVGDFGLVKFLSEETKNTNIGQASSAGIRGTVGYAAPEYGMGSEVSTHGDMYSYGILLLEMFSGKRPTDDMFSDNMNLHNYVKRALPHRVEDIVEPILLDISEDETDTNRRYRKVIESLVLIFGIGIACSDGTPTERMNTGDVLAKLLVIRDKLTDNGGRGRRAQVPRTRNLEV